MDARVSELMKKAQAGDAEAQHRFGTINLYGEVYDPDEGIRWYREAASQGHLGAMKSLALALSYADDVRHDRAESLEIALELASKGDLEMQVFAANLYIDGKGVNPDLNKAYKLALGAAEQGYSDAQMLVGDMLAKGLGAEKDLLGAVKWYEKALENGALSASNKLNSVIEESQSTAISAFYDSRAYKDSGLNQGVDLNAKKNSSLGM